MPKTAAIVIIGNEILSGRIQDSNSWYLASELHALGVDVRRISVVPDEVEAIAAEVSACSRAYDFVFTAGGVGPTHDDVTMQGIARGFGVGTVVSPVMADVIKKRCGTEEGNSSMKMAEVPEGAEVVAAEGLRFPPVVVKNVYIFPGIPEFLKNKFSALRERFRSQPFLLRRIYVNEEECLIARHLDTVVEEFGDVMVGSYPKVNEPDYKVVITLESTNPEALLRAHERLLGLLPEGSVVRTE